MNSDSNLRDKKNKRDKHPVDSRSLKSFLAALFISAFVLNLFWEMIQVPAYSTMSGFSWFETVRICTIASLADATIALGIYGVGALATGRSRWAMESGWKHYLVFALLGAIAATIIELLALATDYWIYHEQMPIIPIFGVGLYPFLQLTLLMPVALWLARWWNGALLKR